MQVKDIMTKSVKYIDPNTTLKEAAQIMLDKDIGSLPIGENDRLIGIITDRDIAIRATSKGQDPTTATVKQTMTPKCLYCFEEDSIEEAAKSMGTSQIRRLPVLNKEKRLVGIISLGDIACKAAKQTAGDALCNISQQGNR